MTAGQDGGFDLQVEAALTDRLLLHVVITGQNEVVLELTPFLSADGRGGLIVDLTEAVTFTTLDGVIVTIEAETFDRPTIVRVDPQPVESWAPPHPADFNVSTVFDLDFGGAEALKPIQIALPLPAGLTGNEGPYLLSREETILGESRWMMYDLMRFDGTGLTTEPDPGGQAGAASAATGAAVSATGVGSLSERSVATLSPRANLPPAGWKAYVPGAVYPGRYSVFNSTGSIGFVAIPLPEVKTYAYYDHQQIDGLVAQVNAVIDRFLAFDAILLPTRLGETFSIAGRDSTTGYKFYEASYDPPTAGKILFLSEGDQVSPEPPIPVSGSPLRFFTVTAARSETIDLAEGIEVVIDAPTQSGTLTVQGSLGEVGEGLHVRVIGLDDEATTETHATAAGGEGTPGDFSLSTPIERGKRYLVAVGAIVGSAEGLRVSFSEGLPRDLAGIRVLDKAGKNVEADVEPDGDQATVRISLPSGWRSGEKYTLHLGPEIADSGGNSWNRTLDLEFKIEGAGTLDTLDLPEVRDVARLGGLLFVAAGADGLAVIDGSDPQNLENYVQGGGSAIYFPLPSNDPVYGVTVDPHGRVFIVGGGKNTPGWLEIFDPLDLDLAAIAAFPNDTSLRAAAFNGKSVVSDSTTGELSGQGNTLPAGTPRRVKVLSSDKTDRWRIGIDPAPAGIVVLPEDPPAEGGPYDITVSGTGEDVNRPVTLRDLDRGRWTRSDTELDSSFTLSLTVEAGDSLELLRNNGAVAYVATLGVGIEAVGIDGFYNEPEGSPTYGSDVLGIYSGFEDPKLSLCGTGGDISGATLDVGLLSREAVPHPLTVVGLVGLRGLIFLDSPLNDVGNLSRFGDLCLTIDGSRAIQGLEVLQHYAFDLDGDGVAEESEARDYLLVAHRTRGLLILDATDRDHVFLVSRIDLPGGAAHLGLDREGRKVYVAGAGAGVYVLEPGRSADGRQDRPERGRPGRSHPGDDPPRRRDALADPPAAGPRAGLRRRSRPRPDRPLGRRSADRRPRREFRRPGDGRAHGEPVAAGHPPGALRRADGARVEPARCPETCPARSASWPTCPASPAPRSSWTWSASARAGSRSRARATRRRSPTCRRLRSTGTDGVVLHRLSDNPLDEGYQLYLSERDRGRRRPARRRPPSPARPGRTISAATAARCRTAPGRSSPATASPSASATPCGALLEPTYGAGPSRRGRARARPASAGTPARRSARSRPSTRPSAPATWRRAPCSTRASSATRPPTSRSSPAASISPSPAPTAARPSAPARSARAGTSATTSASASCPTATSSTTTGAGGGRLFEVDDSDDAAEGSYKPPAGRFVVLTKTAAGWVWIGAHKDQMRFDRFGRLVAIADAVRDSDGTGGTKPTGNEMRFTYDAAGRLVRIADTLDRDYHLEYDADGRLTKLTDFDGRAVNYAYDTAGRLASVTSPEVTVGESTFPDGLTTTYTYETASGDLAGQLTQRDNLASITDARGDRLARPHLHRRLRRRPGRRGDPRDLGRRLCSRSPTTSPPAPRRSPTGGTTPGPTSTTPTATRPS